MIAANADHYIDLYFGLMLNDFPTAFTLEETALGTSTQANVTDSIKRAEDSLAEVKSSLAKYFNPYLIWLIVLGLVFMAGIAAIHRSVSGASRSIGATFLAYGIVGFGGVLISRYFLPSWIFPVLETEGVLPPALAEFLRQFASDFLSPMFYFSLVILILGIIAFVFSFFYRRSQHAEKAAVDSPGPE